MSKAEDEVLHLVGMAYDAALDDSKWSSFLEAFAAAVGGASAFLRSNYTARQSVSFNASVGYDPAWKDAYCKHFVKVDYYDQVMNQYPPGTVVSSARHVDQRELSKTEYFNDYLLPQDKRHAIGASLVKNADQTLIFAAQRGRHAEGFGEEEARLIAILAPHVTRAVQVHQKIHVAAAEKEQMQCVFDQLRMGVILTNRASMPVYLNRSAELLMTQDVGLSVLHNRLVAGSPTETALLQQLIRGASVGVDGFAIGGDMRIKIPNKAGFLQCVIAPVSSGISRMMGFPFDGEYVAVFLSQPDGLHLSPKRLIAFFKLTPAEARLAAKLATLKTLEESASELGITVSTARTQLKLIFAKIGVRSQSELLMFLATGTLAQLNQE